MGIFDDAIREHLDLKRQHGADESEVKQLEDEAFGLPARPGDPDFPETGSQEQAPAADQAPAEVAEAVEAPAETPHDEATAVAEAAPAEPAPPESAPAAAAAEEEAPPPDPEDQAPPHGDALLADAEDEPPPPPEDLPVEDPDAPSFSTTEREAIGAQPTEFFDQAPDPLELGELDLDLEEELEDVGTLDEPATGEEPVETPMEEPTPVDEHTAVEEEPPAAEEGAESAEDAEPAPEESEAEDVLEETPEFLRDNPDDDELWFEQGQPKDFDF